MRDKLTFLKVTELSIDALAESLSDLHFAVRNQKRDSAYWRWRYLDSPFGKSILNVALRGSRVVGMYGLLYLPLTVQCRMVIGGLMGDFSIYPSERSWRCYNSLVEMNIVESQKNNPAFRFGIVPFNLAKLFQRFGVISLGRAPIYLGFLNFARILEGRSVPYPLSLTGWLAHPVMGLRSIEIREIDLDIRHIENFDSAFDELWSSIAKNRTVAINKNATYLNWRYGKCPGCGFWRLAAYREKRLEGLVIFCATGVRNGSFILELLARDDNPDIMRALLLKAFTELRTKRIGYVTASFPAESQTAVVLKELGFKPWGARFWSFPVMIVASSAKEPCPQLDIKNWDFSLGDWVMH